VEILAAQQTLTNTSWYEGTADAVRKNLIHFLNHDFDYLLILSGDQLYRMDFRPMVAQARRDRRGHHRRHDSGRAARSAIAGHHANRTKTTASRASWKSPRTPRCWIRCGWNRKWYPKLGIVEPPARANCSSPRWAFTFSTAIIRSLLDNPLTDFGKHIIPHAINERRVFSYVFQGYWEDIGTIRSFFEANLDLVSELPRFNFFDMNAPIFSRPRFLPGSKINGAQIDHALISDGCIINRATISQQHRRPAHHRRRGHGIEPRHHPRQRLLRIAGIGGTARTRRQTAHRHRRELQDRERHH
jgi:glucose-1-phosphate adenylyltransferase